MGPLCDVFNTLSIAKSFTLDSDEMIVDIMYGWWAASMHTQYLVSVREGGDPYSLDISDLGL
jgi:hypothetical protein